MIEVAFKGRLGNQLFQYAASRAVALKKGYDLFINTNFSWHGQNCLLQKFNIVNNPKEYTRPIFLYNQPVNSYHFDETIFEIPDGTLIDGHFENEAYFDTIYENLKLELTVKDKNVLNYANNFLTLHKGNSYKLIGIHFRRGDAVDVENQEKFNSESLSFVIKALDIITNNSIDKFKIVLFTGGQIADPSYPFQQSSTPADIDWCKNFNYNSIEVIMSPGSVGNEVLLDYHLLSKCDVNILPTPSTFSWMASYLNDSNLIYYNHLSARCNLPPAKKFLIIQ